MIIRDLNGRLSRVVSGVTTSYGVMDGQFYTDLLEIEGAQQAAALDNTQKEATYRASLSNAQLNVDAGRPPAVLPAVPTMTVVDDFGSTTNVPFIPPLPVIKPLVSTPSGSIAAPSLDKLGIVYNMVSALYKKEFPNG